MVCWSTGQPGFGCQTVCRADPAPANDGATCLPCHRIDRKTGASLLFALDPEMAWAIQDEFMAGRMDKRYLALVRVVSRGDHGRLSHHQPRRQDRRCSDGIQATGQDRGARPFGKHTTSPLSSKPGPHRPNPPDPPALRSYLPPHYRGSAPWLQQSRTNSSGNMGHDHHALHAHQLSFTHPRTKKPY